MRGFAEQGKARWSYEPQQGVVIIGAADQRLQMPPQAIQQGAVGGSDLCWLGDHDF